MQKEVESTPMTLYRSKIYRKQIKPGAKIIIKTLSG